MKKAIFSLVLIGAVIAEAKVKGFHEMIEANSKSQKELLNAVQTQITTAETASEEGQVVYKSTNTKELKSIEVPAAQHNLVTNKEFLTTEKEKFRYQVRPDGKINKVRAELVESENIQ